MKILFTSYKMNRLTGTETFLYTMIGEAVKQGHDVSYFTFAKGAMSRRVEKDHGAKSKLDDSYDLILANHVPCVAKVHGLGPIIQTCHGVVPVVEQPSKKADAHVAMSKVVFDHLRKNYEIAAPIVLNGIDCGRFMPYESLNETVKSVLAITTPEAAAMIKKVCKKMGIKFTWLYKKKSPIWKVEKHINKADVVFSYGRGAYEALACGRAVFPFDIRKYYKKHYSDGLLNKITTHGSVMHNCSGRSLYMRVGKKRIAEMLETYNPDILSWNRQYAVENIDIQAQFARYLQIADEL